MLNNPFERFMTYYSELTTKKVENNMARKIIGWLVYGIIISLLVWGGIYRTKTLDLLSPESGKTNTIEDTNKNQSDLLVSCTGKVIEITNQSITIRLAGCETPTDATDIKIERRGWRYLHTSGFEVNIGDVVELDGFFENGIFETSAITQQTTGLTFQLRDEFGHPVWSGSGD
jgi:hypothetical protein